ncbi:MAG: hypothetical protein LC775_11710 [Acidobacteria bacterium]|nr:hypothetical protein [Acidobacteriota bacterium]
MRRSPSIALSTNLPFAHITRVALTDERVRPLMLLGSREGSWNCFVPAPGRPTGRTQAHTRTAGDLPDHPGEFLVVAAGPGFQRGGQRFEPLVSPNRTQ